MAPLAVRARPPFVTIVALFGLTLIAGPAPQAGPEPQTREEHVLPWPGTTAHAVPLAAAQGLLDRDDDCCGWRCRNAVPPPGWLERDVECPPGDEWQTDARPWNLGGMVMGVPATNDRIAHNALTDLLSGLFDVMRSLRV